MRTCDNLFYTWSTYLKFCTLLDTIVFVYKGFIQISVPESLYSYAIEEFNTVMYPYCFILDNLKRKPFKGMISFLKP